VDVFAIMGGIYALWVAVEVGAMVGVGWGISGGVAVLMISGSSVMVGIGAVKTERIVAMRTSAGTELVDSRMISSIILGSIAGIR